MEGSFRANPIRLELADDDMKRQKFLIGKLSHLAIKMVMTKQGQGESAVCFIPADRLYIFISAPFI